ncbi:MAG: PIG-L deacetylase family protein [Lentimicrobium sp.]
MEKNILIVAPHPDDEVLGCGGVMAKFAGTGLKVYVLVVTRGTPKLYSAEKIDNIRREARNAHAILGVAETVFLDFPAPELDIISLAEISREIAEVIRKYNITDLYIPHRGDIHGDHRVVFNACLVAARPVGDCSVKSIFAYETLSETEWAPPFGDDAFIPARFVDVSTTFDKKLEAMKCFKSQLKQFPNPRSIETLTALSRFRGSTVGFTNVEAFMVIRIIE